MYRSRQEDVQVLNQQLGGVDVDTNYSGDVSTQKAPYQVNECLSFFFEAQST